MAIKSYVHRAFTMIELIFAIVIIGVISISIPIVMATNAKSVEQNILQEGILIVATKVGQVMTYPWDHNSLLSGSILAKTEVLDVATSYEPTAFDRENALSDFRRGHFQEPKHRRMVPHSDVGTRTVTPDPLGLEEANITLANDIDDINGISLLVGGRDEEGYKKDYNVSGIAHYINDAAYTNVLNGVIRFDFNRADVNTPTNIKMVEINIRERNISTGNWGNSPIIVFRAFSSNIGETDYYSRRY